MSDCIFCKEGADFSFAKSFLGNDWPFQDRVVYSDNNIFAVIGYSPQVCPYVLIIPYRHIFSLAQMNEDEKQSFYSCLKYLCSVEEFSNSLCFFEHGGSSKNGSSSIDHCHIHVIPNKYKFFDNPSLSNFHTIQNTIESQLFPATYYLVGECVGEILKIKIKEDTIHEHQYFRKILADVLGENQWDWKANMRFDLMIDSMNAFVRHDI